MKKFSLRRISVSGKLCYHFFAVVGMISSIGLLISWITVNESSDQITVLAEPASKDINVSTAEAAAAVEAYKWKILKDASDLPRGYFISRDAVQWLLQDPNNNGVYVYPGYAATGKYCLIVEGGRADNAGQRIVEGMDGKRVKSETLCPTDCGSLAR